MLREIEEEPPSSPSWKHAGGGQEPDGDQEEEGIVVIQMSRESAVMAVQKTTLDVLGICCPSEAPLVKKIVTSAPGVQDVVVNVAAKTVTVQHDASITTAEHLVKLLNDARLRASIHTPGEWKASHRWPSKYTVASGLMVAVAFFHYLCQALRWAGLGAVAVGIPPIALRGLISLRRRVLDINVLLLIAVSGAIAMGDYLEAGSTVFLFTFADWLEARSTDRARVAISSVANLVPQKAVLAESGDMVMVDEVAVGTLLCVKAGELVPLDGKVVSGRSMVDESSLTGEALPVEKQAGEQVWAGTLALSGFLGIETVTSAKDCTMSKMAQLIEAAQNQRSTADQLVQKFAKYYTPTIVVAAIVIAIIPIFLQPEHMRHWLYLALVLLVVACPCALVLSTPIVTTCGIACGAHMGLIIKSGHALEVLGGLKVMALDKTGTLTEGWFKVEQLVLFNKEAHVNSLLLWISSIESKASHPLASALVEYAKAHGVQPHNDVKDFTVLVGEGVSGVVEGHIIHIGNAKLARRLNWTEGHEIIETWRHQGWSICWIGVDNKLAGILSLCDHLRSDAVNAINGMKKLGLHIAMLTGDSTSAANFMQIKLGDIEVYAGLLPKDKVDVVTHLKSFGLIGMVGDGINDAPALAAADVGIAMGVVGSAIAMETADVSLMTNNLENLVAVIKLGKQARKKIQQNIFLSIATKLLIVVLAIVGYASLWGAVLADVGTCLVVIFNSMLLMGKSTPILRGHKHDYHHTESDGHQHHLHNKLELNRDESAFPAKIEDHRVFSCHRKHAENSNMAEKLDNKLFCDSSHPNFNTVSFAESGMRRRAIDIFQSNSSKSSTISVQLPKFSGNSCSGSISPHTHSQASALCTLGCGSSKAHKISCSMDDYLCDFYCERAAFSSDEDVSRCASYCKPDVGPFITS